MTTEHTNRRGRWVGLAALAVALLCLALAGTASARSGWSAPAQASVVGGHPAAIADLPSLAFVEAEEPGGEIFTCSAAVVAPRLVLTAGHCVVADGTSRVLPGSRFSVLTSTADTRHVKVADFSLVSRALVFPKYDPFDLFGDAGLLILSAPVSAAVLPLASPGDGGLLRPRTKLAISGWGLTRGRAAEGPAHLRTGTSAIARQRRCAQEFPFGYTPSDQFCALDSPGFKVGGCFGDSGGPAIAQRADGTPVEIGIASEVSGLNCDPNFPTAFQRADRVAPWVSHWIAEVEERGALPADTSPLAHTPVLSPGRTREFAGAALAKAFGKRFIVNARAAAECRRADRMTSRCLVSWHHTSDLYFGEVTITLVEANGEWTRQDGYSIDQVHSACWFGGGRRLSCPHRHFSK